ncbi:uncharacterized protein AMSG_06272 [Thecamonas trahens ATCC 50062]|uniref:TIR domain-containing protein n=1 Tax=Thecamonas trahens ATCC 50062 TaxID=461836 RepID=A0A0L0DCX2_THETB|nr:hypothetical protein AMSG_06272 [Thecamonas trahens ATCC 50062]KNC49961.1 hypothetical protein AMSG_06272 [Thecamonas trahens ATCC 50062]|eukprot:XP_013757435.1 hypothetical protein AMSG_06272 [Thecamonas trahens ATCC 50062]
MAGTKAGRKIQGMAESAYSRTPAGKRTRFLIDLMEAQFDAETMTGKLALVGVRARGRGGQVDLTPEALPGWAGTPLADGEFEVGVCAASEDVEFANALAEVLIEGGFSVTTAPAALHNTRVFVLVYSEFTVAEAPSRLLTDASSRFNNGLTTIIPVVHPRCSPYVLDKIPDSLAVATAEPPFGEYVDAQYVGRIPIENDSLEAWRYEFECQFTARSLRYCFFLTDGGKIVRAMAQADRTAHSRASQHDVMISYRSTDAGFVDVLQAYLEDHGVSVWRDRRMEAGTDWSSTIAAASRGASA